MYNDRVYHCLICVMAPFYVLALPNLKILPRLHGFVLCCLSHFEQYFSCIVAVGFIGGGPGENHRPVASPYDKVFINNI